MINLDCTAHETVTDKKKTTDKESVLEKGFFLYAIVKPDHVAQHF